MRPAIAALILGLPALALAAPAQAASPVEPQAAVSPYAPSAPLTTARLFAPGVVATSDYERDGTFTPDGREFYFTKRTMWPSHYTICVTRWVKGKWIEPEVAPFSGQYSDLTPFISSDGSKLYFASRRPIDGQPHRDLDLWMVTREEDKWSEPQRLPAPINSPGSDYAPSMTRDGTLYYASSSNGGGILRSHWSGEWSPPEVVSDATAGAPYESAAFVDPDERFMIVTVSGGKDAMTTREGIYERGDLYIRERKNGVWSALRHLPAPINSAAEEGTSFLSPDGRYLFFTSERGPLLEHDRRFAFTEFEKTLHSPGNGLGDIYQVGMEALGIQP
ncbi:MAG: hypothetical protein ABI639_08420 [Thermoanaerobaculia bacterium]